MSTSLLYHAFGAVGYVYKKTEYDGGRITFSLESRPDQLRCAACSCRRVKLRGTKERLLRTLPIGKKPVWLRVTVQRLECLACGAIRQAKLRIADACKRHTKAFRRYVLDLCRSMTMLDIARHLGVSWDVVKEIQKEHLKKRYERPDLKDVRLIAIDEISIRKGHRYLTVVADLETGRVIFVGDGKGADALEPLWKRLGRRKRQIEAVAMDMSAAYIEAVTRNLPGAKIVFDHFHVVKLFNEKLAGLRRDLQREVEDAMEKKALKGTRWLLLKNPENLDPKRSEKERLEEALRLNEPLAAAYYMKEDLRQLWSQDSKQDAELVLDDWIKRARASKVAMLMKFATTLAGHRSGILAYYDHRISTGPLEGINNKIKTMKRQAYGFRDDQFFKLKIKAIHETKYALVG